MNKIGLTDKNKEEIKEYKDLYLGRVVSQYKDLYKVISDNGEINAEVSGKFRYDIKKIIDYPTVGDFVMMDRNTDDMGNAIIHNVLSRKSALIRKAAGTSKEEQIVASNIDKVFICMSLNNDFNLRRLERYISISWESGASPIIILTKSDLCDDIESYLYEVDKVAIGVDIIITSNEDVDSLEELESYIAKGDVVAFIGSSGVGKSTLINNLIGEDIIHTKEVRNDDKGKHTTTNRELFILSNGAMAIDTPGMRELGIEQADISKTFSDVEELSLRCRFSDCKHIYEHDCAVREAIESGIITEERLLSYNKLKKEEKYDGLNSRQIEHLKVEEMFGGFDEMKNIKKYVKNKNKRR